MRLPLPQGGPVKTCEYCGRPIEGEALPITPVSERGAAPTVYWHKERAACGRPRPPRAVDSPLQRQLRRA